MPVIEVMGLSESEPKHRLAELAGAIQGVVLGIEELCLSSEDDVTVFPFTSPVPDSHVVIKIIGMFEKPERTREVKDGMAKALIGAVKLYFPQVRQIECIGFPFKQEEGTFTLWRKNDD